MTFSWHNTANKSEDDIYYSVQKLKGDGMEALRALFPDGHVDADNFVLFSTSGVHGTYTTIEQAESRLTAPQQEAYDLPSSVTFLVVQPRIVCLRYGSVQVKSASDAEWLKKLRQASWDQAISIGVHVPF